MPTKFIINRQVEFHESDAAGIVHFSKVATWVEAAERNLLEKSGISYFKDTGTELSGFPKAAFNCNFHHPVEVNDSVEVAIWITKVGTSSIQYNFSVTNQKQIVCSSGELVSVYANFNRQNKEINTQELPKTLHNLVD